MNTIQGMTICLCSLGPGVSRRQKFSIKVRIENTHIVLPCIKKYLTRWGEFIIFLPRLENDHSPNLVIYFFYIYTTTLCTYFSYLSASYLLSFIISNTDKHEFSSIWKWISCCNDLMNHVACLIKRDVSRKKMHLCSENIRDISVFALKISVVYQKIYMGDIAWMFA